MEAEVRSGVYALDQLLQGLRWGDNVVWQVEHLADYRSFAQAFMVEALGSDVPCIYFRFGRHEPLPIQTGVVAITIDPAQGFHGFVTQIHQVAEEQGRRVFYIFDDLSDLVSDWASDELLASFFQLTCPLLRRLETIAYFALRRGRHSHAAVARIRDTTQILLDVFQVQDSRFIHPLKVWDRYSPEMYLPHAIDGERMTPLFSSADAASITGSGRRIPHRPVSGSIAPWDTVYRKLINRAELSSSETRALKGELMRMLFGHEPRMGALVEAYFTLDDLMAVRERVIGSGQIGGKAVGMLLARQILRRDQDTIAYDDILEEHDSFFLGSDAYYSYLVNNNLYRLRLQASQGTQLTAEAFAEVEEAFLQGSFPPEIVEQLEDILEYFGQAPLIVRSSSLLEDSFGRAFAGKYRSEFCANQGSPEQRLENLLRAIKLVYASTLNPDALYYRQRFHLVERDEQMAILIQRVAGCRCGQYFFPDLAGVAFSHNPFVWTSRIDPDQGLVRLVFGLGTRAVNRVAHDYPRMFAVSEPLLRPEPDALVARYSQWYADVIDLEQNQMRSLPIREVLGRRDYPQLHLLVSERREGLLLDPISRRVRPDSRIVFTFNGLLARTPFAAILGDMLAKLEAAYGQAVDTEFTATLHNDKRITLNVVQCRPMNENETMSARELPRLDDSAKQVVFRTNQAISGGAVPEIAYIVYVDPAAYGRADWNTKRSLRAIIQQINNHPKLEDAVIMLMGPGRWGTTNLSLGIGVGFGDIAHAHVLVEIAVEEAGYAPDLSFGTHFFQDLVEAEIVYLPVYPGDQASAFDAAFFTRSPSTLQTLVPEAEQYDELVRVIHVPEATGGCYAWLQSRAQSREAVCFLAPKPAS